MDTVKYIVYAMGQAIPVSASSAHNAKFQAAILLGSRFFGTFGARQVSVKRVRGWRH